MSWLEEAACRGMDPALFFPKMGDTGYQAKQTCEGCPVRAECLADAVAHGDEHGIRGGLNARTRHKLIGRRRPAVAQCGTDAGYMRHIRTLREAPCHMCRDAHAEAQRARRQVRLDRMAGVRRTA